MSDRRLFSSDYVFKTIKNEDVENIIKNVRKNRRTTKNDRGMWEEYCDQDTISVTTVESDVKPKLKTSGDDIETISIAPQSNVGHITPIKVRRLSDLEISDLIDRAINEVANETCLTGKSQEIQNKPRRMIKRLDRVGNNAVSSHSQGDGAQNVFDDNNDNKPKLEVIYNNKRPASCKRFINRLENITEMVSQENLENGRKLSAEKVPNTQTDDRKIRHPKLTNQQRMDGAHDVYPMVIKSSETLTVPMKKNSFTLPPEALDAAANQGFIDQSRLSDVERFEMMRLFNKKRRQLKKDSTAIDAALRENSATLPEVYISNDSTTSKRNSMEMKTKQLAKITNYQQKSMNLIDQLRFNLLEIQNVGIDSKIIKFYSSSNSFLVNFSKNFLDKINSMIAEMPSINVSQQIFVINLKIYEAVLFYIKNKMFTTYDHNLEKLDELINVISTSILISFEFNIFDENDLISQRFLQECRNLSACIKNIQRKKEIQFQKNPPPNLSKRFNPANSPRTGEQAARYAMYGLNMKESKSYSSKGKVQNTKIKTKSKCASQSAGINRASAKTVDKTIVGKKDIRAKRGYSQKENDKMGPSKRGTKKEPTRSRSQPESKIELDGNRSDQSLKVIYPICDDFVTTVIENVDVDETEHLTPYIPKPLTLPNKNLEELDMSPATYRFDCGESDPPKMEIGIVKQEILNAVIENFEEYMSNESSNQALQSKSLEKHLQDMQSKDWQEIEKPLINDFLRLELDEQKFKV